MAADLLLDLLSGYGKFMAWERNWLPGQGYCIQVAVGLSLGHHLIQSVPEHRSRGHREVTKGVHGTIQCENIQGTDGGAEV